MNLRLSVRSVAAILSVTLLALSLGCLYPEPGYWYGPRHGYGRRYGPDHHYHGR